MLAYDTLLPDVLPECPGVSIPLALREIRNAIIRLCNDAALLKRTVVGETIAADDPRVLIDLPLGYNLVHLQSVTIDGEPVHRVSEDQLDLQWPDENLRRMLFSMYHTRGGGDGPHNWRTLTQERPEAYYIENADAENRIRLVGIPTTTKATLDYRMVLKPLRSSTEIDDFVIEDNYQTIIAGAIGGLLKIPKKPWTDLQTSGIYLRQFEDGISEAKGQAIRDFTRDDETVLRVRPHP